jgi:hypothetical protein
LGHTAIGDLEVTLDWYPAPRVSFTLKSGALSGIELESAATLELPGSPAIGGIFTGVRVSGTAVGGATEVVRGLVSGELEDGHVVDCLLFDVANFPRFIGDTLESGPHLWNGRLHLASGHWRLTLDDVEPPTPDPDLHQRLDEEGGYALTHIGKLERSDETSTDRTQLPDVMAALSQFLSFVAGFNTSVILPRGIGPDGATVWERWSPPKTEPWRARISCFPQAIVEERKARPPALAPIFERIMEDWTNPDWRELLTYGVGWYLTINPHPNSETNITLAQAGLELAAWHHFVPNRMSKTGFDRLNAADKLRLLLTEASIPLTIPEGLPDLHTYAQRNVRGGPPWDDGPQALTEIRNLLVHSTKKLRASDIPPNVMTGTASLATWYLELALMFLLGYRDIYVSRVHGWRQRPVPWTESPISSLEDPAQFPPLLPKSH